MNVSCENMTFKDLNLKIDYDSEQDNILGDFYIPVLSNSKEYYRMAGYFNSLSLAYSARGLKDFIMNESKMKLLCGVELSPADRDAMLMGETSPEELLSENFLNDLNSMEDQIREEHVKVLGWMIAKGLLEVKVVVAAPESNKKGIMHYKVGINKDFDNNIISFSGSINETGAAWMENLEQFEVNKSWKSGDIDHILSKIDLFTRIWEGNSEDYMTLDIPTAVKDELIRRAPDNIGEVVKIYESEGYDNGGKPNLFDTQLDAIDNWFENDKCGIFAMATGTGKTYASLGCLDRVVNDEDKLVTIISVPYKHLIPQWIKSIEDFKFNNDFDKIITVSSATPNGKKELMKSILNINNGYIDKILVISTPNSMYRESFHKIMKELDENVPCFIIADEMHELGSNKFRKALVDRDYNPFKYRLGLSATPNRKYDEFGSEFLLNYFGEIVYEFTLNQAINEINPKTKVSYLTKYNYNPYFINLTADELERYASLSHKILIASNDKEKNSKDIEKMIFQRANIIKNASNKLDEFRNILNNFEGNVDNLIVYCSDEQLDDVLNIVGNEFNFKVKKFTYEESAAPSELYEGGSYRDDIIKDFENGDYECLVAMHCLDEGVDIPSASKAIFLCNSTNPREFIQRLGRILRRYEGKQIAEVYDFIVKPNKKESKFSNIEKDILEKEMYRFKKMGDSAVNSSKIYSKLYG